MVRLAARGGAALGAALVLVTLLPLVPSNEWWIRIWDFPRMQVAALLALLLAAAPLLMVWRRPRTWGLLACLVLALLYQAAQIWPYTPLHALQVQGAASCAPGAGLRLLAANVLMTNRQAEPLLDQVRRWDPDVVLLVETDAWWDAQLAPLKAAYPHVLSRPRHDYYGLHVLSRFELVNPQVRFLIDDYVPSVRTGLRLPSGALVDFHGVHPKPPPAQDTARRDAELLLTAREVRETGPPSIVAGDLNDVAWSRTTRLFQRIGGLVDPRVGRGLYPTFNAHWPLLRWPLDHVFFEGEFRLLDLQVLEGVGSDHFPIFAALCLAPGAPGARSPPDPTPADLRDAAEAIREGHEVAREKR